MKQVFINAAQVAEVVQVDVPVCGVREILVAARASLISTGTETVGYGAGGLFARGLRDPSKVGVLVDSLRERGVAGTIRQIRAKSSERLPRGYSGAGVVVAVGREVRQHAVGDRVAYIGAPHAEYVAVGERVAARIPDGVGFEQAAFGAVACVALHGVRLGEPALGERCVVSGLGLVGLLAAQFARAAGLDVIGVEPLSQRRDLARQLGLTTVLDPASEENLPRALYLHTAGIGADILYLCAAGKDSRVTNVALACCRDRGRVVVLGDVGLDLDRAILFEKELELRVSRSAGPGRYDRHYESAGVDYPVGYVRWTEGRNLVCFLELIAHGRLQVTPLLSVVVPIEEAATAYSRLVEDPAGSVAAVLTYAGPPEPPRAEPIRREAGRHHDDKQLRVGVIGAGAFVMGSLLPHFRKLNARLYAVANRSPGSFSALQALYDPEVLTTSAEVVFADPAVDAVIIGTRHNLHYPLAETALIAGKPVYVEKPMTLTLAQAEALAGVVQERQGLLTVGFNRRLAPTTLALREALAGSPRPRQFLYRVNAPPVPADHWLVDPQEGGGRLVGEGCHFIDLLCYLADADVLEVSGGMVGGGSTLVASPDNFALTTRFANGDLGTVVYSGQGAEHLAKERLEVFAGGCVFVLDDFVALHGYGVAGRDVRLPRADKGFRATLANFFDAVRGQAELCTTVDDGLRVARVIDAFLRRPGSGG